MKFIPLVRAVGSRLAFVAMVLGVAALGAFLAANGASGGTALFAAFVLLSGTLAMGLRGPTTRPRTWFIAAALSVVLVGLVAVRVTQAYPTEVQVCDGAACSGASHWWERVLDEQECAQAGLLLTTRGEEGREMRSAFASAYESMPPSWRGGPNALLMTSHFGGVRSLRFEPKGEDQLPTVVFLHGFGGLLSPYMSNLARHLGDRFIIVAPALDNVGVWRSRKGQEVLRATLASLPSRADRSRVFLVGLSNGGVGATTALLDPELRGAFAGFVLLSGVGVLPQEARLEGARVLVVTGQQDPRFPLSYVLAQIKALHHAGANVDALTLPATHALVFTHAETWISHFGEWSATQHE